MAAPRPRLLEGIVVPRSTLPPHWWLLDERVIKDLMGNQLLFLTCFIVKERLSLRKHIHAFSHIDVTVVDHLDPNYDATAFDPAGRKRSLGDGNVDINKNAPSYVSIMRPALPRLTDAASSMAGAAKFIKN